MWHLGAGLGDAGQHVVACGKGLLRHGALFAGVAANSDPLVPSALSRSSGDGFAEVRQLVSDLLSTSPMSDAESAAYWAYHLGRTGYFLGMVSWTLFTGYQDMHLPGNGARTIASCLFAVRNTAMYG